MAAIQEKSTDLHNSCACGKVVHGMCTFVQVFVHFSLAPAPTVRENSSSFQVLNVVWQV
jgi:hypothetical protein